MAIATRSATRFFVAAAAADARWRRRRLMITVIQQTEDFPRRSKNKADELVETFTNDYHDKISKRNYDDSKRLNVITILQQTQEFSFQYENRIDALVETFLENLKDDIHDMICEFKHNDNYRGLDSDRDTEAQVETILRLFPSFLTRRKEIFIHEVDHEKRLVLYPIQLLAIMSQGGRLWLCNTKAALFIPLFAGLAIELGLFKEEERGGLLCERHIDRNVLHDLMRNDTIIETRNQEHHKSIDTKYLRILIKLRKLGLLIKEDIQMYDLLMTLSCQYVYSGGKRSRFLVEWDPSALLQTSNAHDGRSGNSPIHYHSTRGFQSVFEYGIKYFPATKGINLLFRKNNIGETPFQLACGKYGNEQVMKVVEDTLIRYTTNHAPPFNIVKAFMMAASNESVHFDSVFFLLCRHPDVLINLLSGSIDDEDDDAGASDKNSDYDDDGTDRALEGDSNDSNNTHDSSKKRKRGSSLLL